jgi:hypothetical protein
MACCSSLARWSIWWPMTAPAVPPSTAPDDRAARRRAVGSADEAARHGARGRADRGAALLVGRVLERRAGAAGERQQGERGEGGAAANGSVHGVPRVR